MTPKRNALLLSSPRGWWDDGFALDITFIGVTLVDIDTRLSGIEIIQNEQERGITSFQLKWQDNASRKCIGEVRANWISVDCSERHPLTQDPQKVLSLNVPRELFQEE